MVQNMWIKVFLVFATLVTPTTSCWVLARFLWGKAKTRWCAPEGDKYKSVEDAQAACMSQESGCRGVYDTFWDGKGEAHLCKTESVPDPDSEGWVIKPASTGVFKPQSGGALKSALNSMLGVVSTGNFPKWGEPQGPPSYRSVEFQRLDPSEPNVSFDDLDGSVIYAVRRMGWKLCRQVAMQIVQAAKDVNQNPNPDQNQHGDFWDLRLVAIAKEREGWEEFTTHFWPPPAEIYFDTAAPDYPFFKATNGETQGVMKMLTSYMFGGEVAKKVKSTDHTNIEGNLKGEGSILGSVMVVSSSGEVLFHHKEQVFGDNPDDEELRAAMAAALGELGSAGAVSCECDDILDEVLQDDVDDGKNVFDEAKKNKKD